MNKPIAVLISDIHYNMHTIKLADAAMRQAITKANELNVPLIVAGDLHDTKANLRGECVSAMIKTFQTAEQEPIVLIGNHDKINEKSDEHSLEFLKPYVHLIEKPQYYHDLGLGLIPYQHDIEYLKRCLECGLGKFVIMHQGLQGSHMGEYIQNKSAINTSDVSGLRVISGHYHNRQTIDLSNGGKWDYIGNPYTLSWDEANDPEKGFQILYADGSIEFVPTNLRKHRIFEVSYKGLNTLKRIEIKENDLYWIKVSGIKEELSTVTRSRISLELGTEVFKLTLHPLEAQSNTNVLKNSTQEELMDSLIDSLTNTTQDAKDRLKNKWKELCE